MAHALPKPLTPPVHNKDVFLRSMLRELTGVLEQTVGEKEAEAYVNYVGLILGRSINAAYREAFATGELDLEQVAATLVDLKERIDGDFSVIKLEPEQIELINTKCPFGDKAIGRPSLCRMTANVFGSVAAENLGYARVRIDEAIARGDTCCKVTIDLVRNEEASAGQGTEFFGSGS